MAINLADSEFFKGRPTLADRGRERYAEQKSAIKTRLAQKVENRVDEKKEWARAKKEVWARDQSRDRMTKRKVFKMLELDPKRGECHHVAGRAEKAVRFDRRALILLSLETHEKVTRKELRIVGTKFFVVNGIKYIDCDHRVRFVKVVQEPSK